MSTLQNWTNLIQRRKKDFIGGEIEHMETPEGTFRGPITNIVIEKDTLIITTEWTAHLQTDGRGIPIGGGWKKLAGANVTVFRYTIDDELLSSPADIREGRVHFTWPFSRITLYPKGGSKLDPARVQGL